ncbi:hypothetical protein WMY93_000891 [Mugilogobius chulae]|uniref:Guanine nucleotide-binding protein subunit gamma n=1 Tax=Mugilogobius chulae TaxID=88201 RepID=A0AAW0Q247_9GOBI
MAVKERIYEERVRESRSKIRFESLSWRWLGCLRTSTTERRMSSKTQSSLQYAKKMVQQLRIEASIERIKVSKASADLMHYCAEHARHDPLLMGIPNSDNPFKDKKRCTIL